MYLRTLMIVFRSLLLAGLLLFIAAQQALCACALQQGASHEQIAMVAAHDMPVGHACDEMPGPEEHDPITCPHCGADTRLVLSTVQAVPAPVILPTPALFVPAQTNEALVAVTDRPARAFYQAHGPPRKTPQQLKIRFLN